MARQRFDDQLYRYAASQMYQDNADIEVDPRQPLSKGMALIGAWVPAWIWVSAETAALYLEDLAQEVERTEKELENEEKAMLKSEDIREETASMVDSWRVEVDEGVTELLEGEKDESSSQS